MSALSIENTAYCSGSLAVTFVFDVESFARRGVQLREPMNAIEKAQSRISTERGRKFTKNLFRDGCREGGFITFELYALPKKLTAERV